MTDSTNRAVASSMEDVSDGTGRQLVDDIFEESRLKRTDLAGDVDPATLTDMVLATDPYVGFHRGTIVVDGVEHSGETLVVGSDRQSRRYLLKRWNDGASFKAYQVTDKPGEKLRLLNVYRVMVGRPLTGPGEAA